MSGTTFTTPTVFHFQVARQPDGTYTVREKNGLTYTFEAVAGAVSDRAKLLRIADRNGNALTLTYSGTCLAAVTDGAGRRLTFFPDGQTPPRIAAIRDWTSRTWRYTYDANGDLVAFANPRAVAGLQNPVTYTYGAGPLAHAMRRLTLPRGNGMTYEYYANGRVFRHTNDLGETATFSYNEFRREAVAINERGHARRFFFDKNSNPVKIVEENGGERTYTYDASLNRTVKTDPLGHTTKYTYDTNGNVTRITLPSGRTITYGTFDAFHQPRRIKDPRGNYTFLTYDAGGNLLQTMALKTGLGATEDPQTFTPTSGQVLAWTIYGYDAHGSVTSVK